MSTIGSVGAVGAGAGAGGAQATNPASQSNQKQGVASNNQAIPGLGNEQGAGPSSVSSRGIDRNMSSKDFVTLTQKMSSSGGGMKDLKEMINMVLALQILQKTMEAVSEIIDNFVGDKK